MGSTLAVVFLIAVAAILFLAVSAVFGSRSPFLPLVAVLVTAVAGMGAWYAWAESHSIPWTAGYLVVALGAVSAAAIGWIRGGKATPGRTVE